MCACVCLSAFCNKIRLTCPLGGFYTFCAPDELSEICTSHNLTLFGYFCTVKLSVWCATVFLRKMQNSAGGALGGWGAHNIFPSSMSPVSSWAPVTLPSHHRSVIQPYFLSRSFSVALSNCSLMCVCMCVCVCADLAGLVGPVRMWLAVLEEGGGVGVFLFSRGSVL